MIGLEHYAIGTISYNYINKININPFYYIFFSVLPDFDLIFKIIGLNNIGHKTLTHSFLFLIVFSIIIYIFGKLNIIHNKLYQISFIMILFHLIADYIVGGKIYLYWFSNFNNLPLQMEKISILDPTGKYFFYYFIISLFIIIYIFCKNKLLFKQNILLYILLFITFIADFYYFVIK